METHNRNPVNARKSQVKGGFEPIRQKIRFFGQDVRLTSDSAASGPLRRTLIVPDETAGPPVNTPVAGQTDATTGLSTLSRTIAAQSDAQSPCQKRT
jgi:hypothetical protein